MERKVSLIFALFLVLALRSEPLLAKSEGLRAAEALMLQDAYAQAAGECRKLIAGRSSVALKTRAQYLLGICLLQTAEFEQARESFNAVLRSNTHGEYRDDASLGIADSYLLAGDYTQAGQRYEQFLQDYPQSPLLGLAQTHLEESRFRKPYNNSYFSVQVGCFSKKDNAEEVRDGLISSGFQGYILKLPNEELFRVRVGKFSERLQAELAEQQLKAQGYATKICP